MIKHEFGSNFTNNPESKKALENGEKAIEAAEVSKNILQPLVSNIARLDLEVQLLQSKANLEVEKSGQVTMNQKIAESLRGQLAVANEVQAESIKNKLRQIDPAFAIEERQQELLSELKAVVIDMKSKFGLDAHFFEARIPDVIKRRLETY
jgi:Skp family chaperone for outer membrane proteins